MSRIYRQLNLIAGVIVTVMGVCFIGAGVQLGLWTFIAASTAIIALWWYAFYRLEKGSVAMSFVMNSFATSLVLANMYRECAPAEGHGVNMVRTILGFEMCPLVYFSVTATAGLILLLQQRREARR